MQPINHQQAQEFLHMRRIDLSEAETLALQAHLESCAECRQYAATLEVLDQRLRASFHARWDVHQPPKSQAGSLLIRQERQAMRVRLSTFAGTLGGVLALVALVFVLNVIFSSLRPQPMVEPTLPGIAPTIPAATPSAQPVITPTIDLLSHTQPPEGTIVLNWGKTILPPEYINMANGEAFAQRLSAASGLNIVALKGPITDMEILHAMRDGSIHVDLLDPLAFVYGQAQGWIVPGPVMTWTYQPSGKIMFVSRNDSGLVAGESDQMYQQLAGKQPCWPNLDSMNWPPVYEYIIPAGLLAQKGIQLGEPVWIGHPKLEGMVPAREVFLKKCDFATFEEEPVKGFMSLWFPELGGMGYTFNDWTNSMQVLYTTQPLVPFKIIAFSSQLGATQRELLTEAIMKDPYFETSNGKYGWLPYDEEQAAFYAQFKQLVDASGVDVADYLSRVWDQFLQGLIAKAGEPTPAPTSTAPPSTRTLTICQAAEPDTLYVYAGTMLAAQNVLEAIYDGPIDSTGFAYQPVIFENLPTLDDRATLHPVAVKENDTVVNAAGDVVLLHPGEIVHPYGCSTSDCAITWQGQALEMAQMTASFRLKEGLRWSDGEPLTADDSLFSYEIARSCRSPYDSKTPCGTLGAGGRETMRRTASYIALDERTTQWTGLPGFIDQTYMTNFAFPLPKHQLEGIPPDQLFEAEQTSHEPIGWGPYKIDKWQPGEYIRLSKNPYYFRADEGLPYFDQLVIRFFVKDEEATLTALQNGECDLIDYEQALKHTSLERLLEADQNGQIEALTSISTMWEHLDFNIQPAQSILNSGSFAGWDLDGDGQGPFGDVRLRQAIAMCLDRQKVVDTFFFGQLVVPDTYLPPDHPLFDAQAIHWSFDPISAGKLLDEIGWLDSDGNPATPRLARGVTGVPDGTPLAFNYDTTQADIRQQAFQVLAKSLASCGIQANLKTYPAEEYFKADTTGIVYGRNYDLAQFAWLTNAIPPCDLFLSTQIPSVENSWSGQNTVGFVDPAYDAACNSQLQAVFGEPGYARTVHEAQRIFAEQLPVIPLFMRVKYAAARPGMCGYSMDPTAPSDFWNIEAFNYGEGCR